MSHTAAAGSVAPDPIESSAPLMVSVSGCRGIVGRSLTPEIIARYAAAIAAELCADAGDQPTLVLARDGRSSGDMIGRLVAGTLVASGCRVIDLGVATTPTAGVMVRHHGADGGIVVTASHNPQEWNGIKAITGAGCAPAKALADRIKHAFQAGRSRYADHAGLGAIEADDTAAHVHVARVLDALEAVTPLSAVRGQAFRVVVDPVNGSGARAARLLLEALGCEPIFINENPLGEFAHTPEPTEANLRDLAAQVPSLNAALGFAQDPDADRLAIVDSNGRYIGEEYTLALAARALLEALPANDAKAVKLAANLSTSRMIDDVAANHGASVQRTAVGEANLVEWMLPNNSRLGGEGNGGVIWPEVVPIRDSLSAMGLVLALMARTGQTLADLLDDIPAYAIVKRKTPFDPAMLERLEPVLTGEFAGGSVNTTDGVRLDFDDVAGGKAWLHVRASNTEPIVRLIAEAPTEAAADELLDRAERALTAAG